MSGKPPLPIDQIAKLAADIQVIENYAENHGFASGLLDVTVTPGTNSAHKCDWSLFSLGCFTLLLIVLLSVLAFYEPITLKATNFLIVVGMLLVVGASTAAHKKFDNSVITGIICVGMLAVLLVGSGVFTPREAVEQLQEIKK